MSLGYDIPTRSYMGDDYAAISFTATEQSYVLGSNAIASDPAAIPSWTAAVSLFHDLLFYATQDCYVRFNFNTRVQHLLLSGNFYRFNLKTRIIYVTRATVDGTLYLWAEC